MGLILLILLILLLAGAWPSWSHSRGWGYRPSGILGLILIVVVVLLCLGAYRVLLTCLGQDRRLQADDRVPVFIPTTVHCMAMDL